MFHDAFSYLRNLYSPSITFHASRFTMDLLSPKPLSNFNHVSRFTPYRHQDAAQVVQALQDPVQGGLVGEGAAESDAGRAPRPTFHPRAEMGEEAQPVRAELAFHFDAVGAGLVDGSGHFLLVFRPRIYALLEPQRTRRTQRFFKL